MTTGAFGSRRSRRIGLLGFGNIGSQVYQRIQASPGLALQIAFVHNRNRAALSHLPPELVLDDLGRMDERAPDLVVEMAHPDFSRGWGETILAQCDYLPLSVTALADEALHRKLLDQAHRSGTRLLIPHGALIGTDNLHEWRHMWEEVEIAFFKHPKNIDFSESGYDPAAVDGDTTVYDGPVRGIAALYPRNVNTMVTCALATVGLDRCRARLVACPGLDHAIAEITARGRDGSLLVMRKEQPAIGVSGTEMFESQFGSILRAAGVRRSFEFV